MSYGEIEIRDFVTWNRPRDGEELRVGANVATRATVARDVLRELAEARGRGAAALLVHVTGPGGRCAPAFAIYDALRAFSREVGPVIVNVSGRVASMATVLALAGDVVVIDPGATLIVHSMLGGRPEDVEASNREALAVYRARTRTPDEDLRLWLSLRDGAGAFNFAELDAAAALSWRWADALGDANAARQVAAAVAARRLRVPRRRGEAVRGEVPAEAIGAKLDHQGTALKCAPENLQVGAHVLSDLMQAQYRAIVSMGGNGVITLGREINVSAVTRYDRGASASPRYVLRLTADGWSTTYGFPLLTAGGNIATSSLTAFTPIFVGGATGYIDIGLWSGSAWLDPNSTVGYVIMAGFEVLSS